MLVIRVVQTGHLSVNLLPQQKAEIPFVASVTLLASPMIAGGIFLGICKKIL